MSSRSASPKSTTKSWAWMTPPSSGGRCCGHHVMVARSAASGPERSADAVPLPPATGGKTPCCREEEDLKGGAVLKGVLEPGTGTATPQEGDLVRFLGGRVLYLLGPTFLHPSTQPPLLLSGVLAFQPAGRAPTGAVLYIFRTWGQRKTSAIRDWTGTAHAARHGAGRFG